MCRLLQHRKKWSEEKGTFDIDKIHSSTLEGLNILKVCNSFFLNFAFIYVPSASSWTLDVSWIVSTARVLSKGRAV